MIRQPLRRLLVAVLALSVALGSGTAAAADDDEPAITFHGGGWGHGIGMSQWGAYGRALAGHTYDEILAHYYAGTSLSPVDGFVASDDVDVRVDIRSSIAISTPLDQLDAWDVEVFAGETLLGTSSRPVTASWNGSRWTATWTDPGADPGSEDDVTTDFCEGVSECDASVLAIALDPAERTVLEEFEDGPNLGEYRSGRIILHPASVATAKGAPARCGSGTQFCVIHGDVDFQEYLRGLAEVPGSWPVEALKAQAVAGRSYMASRIVTRNASGNWNEPFDLYEDTQDQVYLGWARTGSCANWCAAVDTTDDLVVTHGGSIAETFYSSSNGGSSAEPQDVWANGSARPYLQATPDEFDGVEANPNAAREFVYSVADVSRWLNDYVDPITGDQLHVGTVRSIKIDAPPSGRVTFATVTIVGSEKTTVVEGRMVDGTVVPGPYGFRFYSALREGCLADDAAGRDCDALRSTNFSVRSVINFADVEYDDYFYLPVQWMTVENLTTGLQPGVFGADEANNRAQLATFIWRFAGEPEPGSPSGFTDLTGGSFYEDAVSWMEETGITTGTSPTQFSPDGSVTRGQAATFLWRFAGSPASSAEVAFTDVASERYYSDAVRWMVEWDITTGTSPLTFSPEQPVTRAQIATFLYRLAGQPGAFADSAALSPAMRV